MIETIDGRVFDSGDIRFPLGNALNPIDTAGLKQKFDDCVTTGQMNNPSLTGVEPSLYHRLNTLEAISNMRHLFQAV